MCVCLENGSLSYATHILYADIMCTCTYMACVYKHGVYTYGRYILCEQMLRLSVCVCVVQGMTPTSQQAMAGTPIRPHGTSPSTPSGAGQLYNIM